MLHATAFADPLLHALVSCSRIVFLGALIVRSTILVIGIPQRECAAPTLFMYIASASSIRQHPAFLLEALFLLRLYLLHVLLIVVELILVLVFYQLLSVDKLGVFALLELHAQLFFVVHGQYESLALLRLHRLSHEIVLNRGQDVF